MEELPRNGFLRLRQIIGDRKNPGMIPVSRSGWYKGVSEGRFPKPVRLSERTVAWRARDIQALIEDIDSQASE